ncbi:uncharacterized protein LOC132740370 [Ruditapes philippinarum]|uniref:uncharacterized protein LOC132740370 n=1 Tax=Ruditapes philippinarum TaxID=129788 RepID=UPI00295B7984|nr:uncharacterized protein LOC132740370 [Ruditapes philippinarum]
MLFNMSVFTVCTLVLLAVGPVESFDYKDEIAQGSCTSIIPDTQPDHVYAVRRTCPSAETCEAVCKNVGKICYNALHVYSGTILAAGDTGKAGLHSYKYNSCTGTGCGPNFCCCANSKHTTPNPLAYKDEIAQSTCTAILPGKAVSRVCCKTNLFRLSSHLHSYLCQLN